MGGVDYTNSTVKRDERTDGQTDGQTDRQMDRQEQILMPPDYRHGGIEIVYQIKIIKKSKNDAIFKLCKTWPNTNH